MFTEHKRQEPFAVPVLSCPTLRFNQLGSLRLRFPFPKKPLCHSIALSLAFTTQTERDITSKIPTHLGLEIDVKETTLARKLGCLGTMGRAFAYFACSGRLGRPLPLPFDAIGCDIVYTTEIARQTPQCSLVVDGRGL
jgi:hypothetical protein